MHVSPGRRRGPFGSDARLRAGALFALVALVLTGCSSSGFRSSEKRSAGGYARAARGSGPRTASDSLVAASYNVRLGENIDEAVADIRHDPILSRADLLLLQEMHPGGCEHMARLLGYDFVYYPADIHPSHGRLFGNAILTRGRIRDSRVVTLPKRGLFSGTARIAVGADIVFESESLRVVTTHLSTPRVDRDVRLDQVRELLDSLASTPGPLLIGGDFNTTTAEDTARFGEVMREHGLRRVALPGNSTIRAAATDPGGVNLLDHFYVRGFEPSRSGVSTSAIASDHFPIWAVFAWPPKQRSR